MKSTALTTTSTPRSTLVLASRVAIIPTFAKRHLVIRTYTIMIAGVLLTACKRSDDKVVTNSAVKPAVPIAITSTEYPMDKGNYLIDLSESVHTEFGRIEFSAQSEPQKVFSAIWALESQVNNGGFLQYFVSSNFDTAEFAPEALRRIGADSCAAIVSRALRALAPVALPASREECESLVVALSEEARDQFDALDSEFYAYPDNLTDLLYDFVAAHPEAFGPTPR